MKGKNEDYTRNEYDTETDNLIVRASCLNDGSGNLEKISSEFDEIRDRGILDDASRALIDAIKANLVYLCKLFDWSADRAIARQDLLEKIDCLDQYYSPGGPSDGDERSAKKFISDLRNADYLGEEELLNKYDKHPSEEDNRIITEIRFIISQLEELTHAMHDFSLNNTSSSPSP